MSTHLLRISAHDDDSFPLLTTYTRMARDSDRFTGCVCNSRALFSTPEMLYSCELRNPVSRPFTCTPHTFREYMATGGHGRVTFIKNLADDVELQRYHKHEYGVQDILESRGLIWVDAEEFDVASVEYWVSKGVKSPLSTASTYVRMREFVVSALPRNVSNPVTLTYVCADYRTFKASILCEVGAEKLAVNIKTAQ